MQEAPGVLRQVETQGFRLNRDNRVSHDRMPREIRLSLSLPPATRWLSSGRAQDWQRSALVSFKQHPADTLWRRKTMRGPFRSQKFRLLFVMGFLSTTSHQGITENDSLQVGGYIKAKKMSHLSGSGENRTRTFKHLSQCRHLKGLHLNPLVLCKSLNIWEDKWFNWSGNSKNI